MPPTLKRLLNLDQGDLRRALPLFAYLFLIIASYMIGRVARDALFLDKFPAVYLPYVDMAIAALMGLVVAAYLRVSRYVSLLNLLVGSLLVAAALAIVFWWLTRDQQRFWLYPVIYVWVGIVGTLAMTQVRTLINSVLTTREAKRLFGLVGSGAIMGGIFGGFFSNTIAKTFGTEALLFVMPLFLVMCAGLVVIIWRQRPAAPLEMEEPAKKAHDVGPHTLHESFRLVWESPYLQSIAGVMCISSVVTALVGWQFKAIAKEFIPQKDALAAFFGAFYGYVDVVALGIQLLLTSRVLRRFGLGPALLILPAALLTGSMGVLVWGMLWTAVWLRGSDTVLRYSIHQSTVELLYLPIPSRIKMQVISCIDMVISRMGDGLGGLTVLICAAWLHVTARQLSWVSCLLLGLWAVVALIARRQFVVTLRESIQQHRLDAERVSTPVLDRSATNILAARLSAVDPNEILYALSLFDLEHRQGMHPAVRDLLTHPSAAVREKALSILNAAGDMTVLPQVEALVHDEHLGVRTEALLYLAHHAHVDPLVLIQELGDFPHFSVRSAMVAFMVRLGEPEQFVAARTMLNMMVKDDRPEGHQTRLEAARLISVLPDQFEDQLGDLIRDPDPDVARQAIHTAGGLGTRRFIGPVLDRLHDPHLMTDAVEVLGTFGDTILSTLRDHLFDTTVPIETRREIPRVLLRIGTPTAEQVLVESLFAGDTVLRSQIIASLNTLQRLHPEFSLDTQMIETLLLAEIMGHYRSYQILGALNQALQSDDSMMQALQESMQQDVERIFRLMALLYPTYDLHSAHFGLQSKNPVVHDNALEFLDNILKPELRDLLVPLLDPYVSVAERVQRADRLIGLNMETPSEALVTLMDSPDPWLKSCAAYTIGTLGLKSLEGKLDQCLNHPDPLLRETARQAKLRLAAKENKEGDKKVGK